VFQGDEFDYALGDSPFVKHKPSGESDPDLLTHVYAIGRVKGSEWPVIEVWPIARVKKHRDRYNKVGNRHYSHQNWEMYARKVVLLQVIKYMPASADLAAAVALNDAAEVGHQNLTVQDAIDGTWTVETPMESLDESTGEITADE
jgi:recombination protein RecT